MPQKQLDCVFLFPFFSFPTWYVQICIACTVIMSLGRSSVKKTYFHLPSSTLSYSRPIYFSSSPSRLGKSFSSSAQFFIPLLSSISSHAQSPLPAILFFLLLRSLMSKLIYFIFCLKPSLDTTSTFPLLFHSPFYPNLII